jgi:hypothetical protein
LALLKRQSHNTHAFVVAILPNLAAVLTNAAPITML